MNRVDDTKQFSSALTNQLDSIIFARNPDGRRNSRSPSPLKKRNTKILDPLDSPNKDPAAYPSYIFDKPLVAKPQGRPEDPAKRLRTPQEPNIVKPGFEVLKCNDHGAQVVGVCMKNDCFERFHCLTSAIRHHHELERVENVFNRSLIEKAEKCFLAGATGDFLNTELVPVFKEIDRNLQMLMLSIDSMCQKLKDDVKKHCFEYFGKESMNIVQGLKEDLFKTIIKIERHIEVNEKELYQYVATYLRVIELSQNPAAFKKNNIPKILQQAQRLGAVVQDLEGWIQGELQKVFANDEIYKPQEKCKDFFKNIEQLQRYRLPTIDVDSSLLSKNKIVPFNSDSKTQNRRHTLVSMTSQKGPASHNLPPGLLDTENLRPPKEIELKSEEPILTISYSPFTDKLIAGTACSIRTYDTQNFHEYEAMKFPKKRSNVLIKCLSTKELLARAADTVMEVRSVSGAFLPVFEFDLKKQIRDYDIIENSGLIIASASPNALFFIYYEQDRVTHKDFNSQLVCAMHEDSCVAVADVLDVYLVSIKTGEVIGEQRKAHVNNTPNRFSYAIMAMHYDRGRRTLYTCTPDQIKLWVYNATKQGLTEVLAIKYEFAAVQGVIPNCLKDNIIVFDEQKGLIVINKSNNTFVKSYKITDKMFTMKEHPILLNMATKGQFLVGLGIGNRYSLFQV